MSKILSRIVIVTILLLVTQWQYQQGYWLLILWFPLLKAISHSLCMYMSWSIILSSFDCPSQYSALNRCYGIQIRSIILPLKCKIFAMILYYILAVNFTNIDKALKSIMVKSDDGIVDIDEVQLAGKLRVITGNFCSAYSTRLKFLW